METSFAVGIDLGTTYSCVAVYRNDQVHVIQNDHGINITASYVAFTDEERLIGDAAKTQVFLNPQNTVFDAKRLIGRKFKDATVQEDMKHWPFKIVDNAGRPNVQVEFKGKKATFTPEEISSMVLTKMKETAETYLRHPVKDAVITVPAYFNDAQRQATKDAATIAGINVLRILNEPTAAGIAYGLDERAKKFQNILIYDFGGGTFDVTIMSNFKQLKTGAIKEGNFIVRATSGDTHLGGEDMDSRLVDYFLGQYKNEHKEDLNPTDGDLRRIRLACEKAKRVLSFQIATYIEVVGLSRGVNFLPQITRARFDELCVDLFKRTLGPVEKVLEYANMEKDEIEEVVLVGGSTRIPKIQKMLSDYFGEKKINKSQAQDEAVARGAAIEAAALSGVKSRILEEIVISDVTPFSLGVSCGTVDSDIAFMSTIIKKNTTIPVKAIKSGYRTKYDFLDAIPVEVFEGEDRLADNNQLLGTFTLKNIRLAPKGEVKFEATFEIDTNGILGVTMRELGTENSASITLTNTAGYLTKEEILGMIKKEEEYRELDSRRRTIVEVNNKLEEMSTGPHVSLYPTLRTDSIGRPKTSTESLFQNRPAPSVKRISVFGTTPITVEDFWSHYRNFVENNRNKKKKAQKWEVKEAST